MLPAPHRLRDAADFGAVLRRGRSAGRRDVVVHLLLDAASDRPPRAGLVVGRRVGGSVTRHRVARRLRAQLATVLPTLPAGTRVVVRAAPSAGAATSAELGRQLTGALDQLARR